ncbi:MAG: MBL fold metallo-hydrolase [Muribaculaceae bacterium]|nr:MBL fold metallo-hydrolase [Muribaculaceae bacterium]
MEIIRLEFNGFAENTYIVFDPATRDCAIIDPGMMTPGENERIRRVIEENNLHPVHLINTHMHIDHVAGNDFISTTYELPLSAHKDDEFLGQRVQNQAQMFGIPGGIKPVDITTYLQPGDEIKVGHGTLQVIHVPGHSPGSIALYDKQDSFVITGDALFAGAIGRTDLPGGDHETLLTAIENNLFTLPDNTIIYPGHGTPSTIGQEKRTNPFF